MSYVQPEYVKTGETVNANEHGVEFNLTEGKEYEVLEHLGFYYKIVNDLGVEDTYSYEYFTR